MKEPGYVKADDNEKPEKRKRNVQFEYKRWQIDVQIKRLIF